MTAFNIPTGVVDWTCHLLKNRNLLLTKGDSVLKGTVNSECPQGGVLSPLLWSLVVDELLRILTEAGYHVIGYADDILLIVRGPYLEVILEVAQKALNQVDIWCEKVSLSVYPGKTEAVIFTRRYKWKVSCSLTLSGKEIKYTEQAKCLGVILDSKLLWKKHLEEKCKKLTAALWQCRRAINGSWGVKPDTLLWIYEAILLPRLTYACVVWWSRVELKTAQTELERVRGMVLRGITGAVRTTPTAALGALLGLEPLHLTIKAAAVKAALRLSGPVGRREVGRWRLPKKLVIIPLLSMIRDRTVPLYLFDKKYRINIPSREDWINGLTSIPADCEVWYTDGSKGGNGVGAGIYHVTFQVGHSFKLRTTVSVLQAEIVAIFYGAVEALKNCRNKDIFILSDSKAAIFSLKRYVSTSRLVGDCHEALNKLAETNHVTLLWIPGHSGFAGNDRADELAKEGARKQLIGPEPPIGVSNKCLTLEIKQWIAAEHQREWQVTKGCRQAKVLMGSSINPMRKAEFRKLNRKEAKIITGLLTGHGDLRYHRHKMGILDDPKCRRCGEEYETPIHILCHCPALVKEREHITGYFFLGGYRYCYQKPGRSPPVVERTSDIGVVMGNVKGLPKR
ncbi:uncharacterized protein LOC122507631 [Leptopilina heterotoma]|uniref:uncharacterized protein LOC122507631 n=1 Tax=Leptopilina heterotoma TaxID=63436 RepID=UPI001CA9F6A5|nr:uncharacterized protein LOC122507631 [Leptopilina heterotoma]